MLKAINGATLRGAAAASLALLVPVVLATGIVRPAQVLVRDRAADIDARLDQTIRMQGIVEAGRRVIESAKAQDTTALTADFLTGGQDSIIVADLQNRLRTLANTRNVELNSASPLPARAIDGLAYLGIRVVFRGQLEDVQHVMHAVETGSPLLFIERLALRRDTWPMKSADPEIEGAPAMIVELDIFGAKQPADDTAVAPDPVRPSTMTATVTTPNPAPLNPFAPAASRGGRTANTMAPSQAQVSR